MSVELPDKLPGVWVSRETLERWKTDMVALSRNLEEANELNEQIIKELGKAFGILRSNASLFREIARYLAALDNPKPPLAH